MRRFWESRVDAGDPNWGGFDPDCPGVEDDDVD